MERVLLEESRDLMRAAVERVIAVLTGEEVVAAVALEEVIARAAEEVLPVAAAAERVVARAAVEGGASPDGHCRVDAQLVVAPVAQKFNLANLADGLLGSVDRD